MLEIFTRPVTLDEAPSIVPAAPPGVILVPGRPEDFASLAKGNVSRYPLWRTVLSGPARSRQEEKWYRALVHVVADGVGLHPDNLHWELKREAGKILRLVCSDQFGLQFVLKSSMQMDDDEFHDFVQIATEIMFAKYLPNVRRKDVFQRVYEITGLRPLPK
jgi:hypothetical protein